MTRKAVLMLLGALTTTTIWATVPVDEDAAFIDRAKEAITYGLKDPESARFRSLNLKRTESGSRVVCGEFNAKNSYGAYVGYREFYYWETLDEPPGENIHKWANTDGGTVSMIYEQLCLD